MKYISVFVLVLILVFSWRTSQSKGNVPFDVHVTIQSELETFIKDYITTELPSAKDIHFHRLWTEEMPDQRLKASFEYSFSDASVTDMPKATLAGTAVLSKNTADAAGGWSLDEVTINNEVIEFKERDVAPTEATEPDNRPAAETESSKGSALESPPEHAGH